MSEAGDSILRGAREALSVTREGVGPRILCVAGHTYFVRAVNEESLSVGELLVLMEDICNAFYQRRDELTD